MSQIPTNSRITEYLAVPYEEEIPSIGEVYTVENFYYISLETATIGYILSPMSPIANYLHY